jgi:DNA-directed RNA polymerase subunit RPC12/RpoP
MSVERKRVEYICVDCSRANIRAIEGRLTEEYWEF